LASAPHLRFHPEQALAGMVPMRLVCLSDTHGEQDRFKVPEGDVLVHAGDFSGIGTEREVHKFARWLKRLPHRWKIVIAGNHDRFFEKQPEWRGPTWSLT